MTKDKKRKLDFNSTNNSNVDSSTLEDQDDILNVEFDFFEFGEVDFHPIKQFLGQLFGKDTVSIQLSELTDWILNSGLGSTVKCDGETGDPFAFISLLGLTGNAWKTHSLSAQVKNWLLNHTSSSSIHTLLDSSSSSNSVGFILNERLINMPWFISAPLFSLLLDELQSESKTEEAYRLTHFLFLFPLYTDEEEDDDDEENNKQDDVHSHGSMMQESPQRKKSKKTALQKKKTSHSSNFTPVVESYLYMEAEYLSQFAEFTFDLKNESTLNTRKHKGMVFTPPKLAEGIELLKKLVDESSYVLSQDRKYS